MLTEEIKRNDHFSQNGSIFNFKFIFAEAVAEVLGTKNASGFIFPFFPVKKNNLHEKG